MQNSLNLGFMPDGLPIDIDRAANITGLDKSEISEMNNRNILNIPKTKICKNCGHRLLILYFENGSENCYIC